MKIVSEDGTTTRIHGDEDHEWSEMAKEQPRDDGRPHGHARARDVHQRLGLKAPTKASDLRVRMAHIKAGVVVNVSEWVPTCCDGCEGWKDQYDNERGAKVMSGKRHELAAAGRDDDQVVQCGPEVGIGWTVDAHTGKFAPPKEPVAARLNVP